MVVSSDAGIANIEVDNHADRIGDEELLGESGAKACDAGVDIAHRHATCAKLVDDLPVANDWPRNQLREVNDIESESEDRLLRPLYAAIDVHQIGNDMEGEERDPKR